RNLVRVSNERHHANAWPCNNPLRTFWPSADVRKNCGQPLFERSSDAWIILLDVGADLLEISERRLGEDDLHARRNFARASFSCWSVANRPSAAARSPRSIPSSSSGEA